MSITFDRLRYFMEVAKTEHVGLAGKSLGVSSSAISAAISTLESEYQCSFFERSNKRVYLNEKGRLLRDRIEPIMEQITALSREISSKQISYRGYLSVGGSFFLANHYLQAVLNNTQEKNPDLRTENAPLRTSQVIQDVLSGLLDYGLCFSPHGHPALEKEVLHTGSLKIIVSKDHPIVKMAKKSDFKLELLNRFPASIHKFNTGIDYCENHPAFDQFGIKPRVKQYFHSDDLCIQSAVRGDLWALVPDVVEQHYKNVLFSIPLPKTWKAPYEICSVYRRTMKDRGILIHLNEQLREMLKRSAKNISSRLRE